MSSRLIHSTYRLITTEKKEITTTKIGNNPSKPNFKASTPAANKREEIKTRILLLSTIFMSHIPCSLY
ncbi:hypothetical protein CWO17_09520 [Vibrio sp. 10N.286.45.A3]|nr:hypothetical protein CWO17_09520 [Vibrio sp. 10N.286.45.A3]PTQ22396.1 hypothetical protein CWO24_18745 [Vibrio sp. 10N.286.46.E10]TKE86007.1 hypothetical protein FCV56_06485 [Vibrio sp. F12]TKE89224.1 hypothetical protein FCV53_20045 [Vibrio sp. F12]TKF00038.1 hypothetical protein FCV61_07460 [Vibrio sp. F12]